MTEALLAAQHKLDKLWDAADKVMLEEIGESLLDLVDTCDERKSDICTHGIMSPLRV